MSLYFVKADLSQLKFFKDMFTCLNLYTKRKYQEEKSTSPQLFPRNYFYFSGHHYFEEERDSKDHVYSCGNCQTCLSKCQKSCLVMQSQPTKLHTWSVLTVLLASRLKMCHQCNLTIYSAVHKRLTLKYYLHACFQKPVI